MFSPNVKLLFGMTVLLKWGSGAFEMYCGSHQKHMTLFSSVSTIIISFAHLQLALASVLPV